MEIRSERPPRPTELLEPVIEISSRITGHGLDASLLALVRVQAAALGGCAACRRTHGAAARQSGVDEMRIERLPDWRDARLFSGKERAVLAWSEAVHRGDDAGAIEAAVREVSRHYSAEEQLLLGIALLAIHEAACPHGPARAGEADRDMVLADKG
ncbi:carboxymuconolactone decarboxylase family protein [Sphingosinicella terrae]|uniref:carboxymuconolactone decarboxylase family protein n=1 Tax=Sphingosinicella terrae TaxID=2172047 RepID=UPI0013B3F820|nr:carboxymuconolactone decarboxylase family protein [Sphingosinicella terrae]